MLKDLFIKDLESYFSKMDKNSPDYDSAVNLFNKCIVILINDTEQIFNGPINQDVIKQSTELEKEEKVFLIFMLETLLDFQGSLVTMPDPLESIELGIIDSNGPEPKDITIGPSNSEIAHFNYYDGIRVAKDRNLKQTVQMKEVIEGTHFIVMCGDVLLRVKEDEFKKVPRRSLVN